MSRRPREQNEAPGKDSFLDVIANLVGILIILVMMIGARAKDSMLAEAKEAPAAESAAPLADVAAAKGAADQVEADVNELARRIQIEQEVAAQRQVERAQVDLLIAAAESTLAERRAKLDEAQRNEYDGRSELLAARHELEDLKRRRSAVESSAAPVAVIDHLPTPMVKTVFGQEAHFRLQDGRLTQLPWDELVAKLKAEAPSKLWKLNDSPTTTETIGPVRGFRMKYILKKTEYTLETKGGQARQSGVELDQFVLIPVTDDLGEPLVAALSPNSEFKAMLKTLDPNRTTITVWVYPESFHQFRELKQELYKLGYLTASRPLPAGQLIGGAPTGTRSVAQ